MNNKLVNFLISLIVGILIIEMLHLAFHLMNQPDSLLFYLGLLIVALESFFIGWFSIKLLNKFFPTEKNEENSK
jgi:hypothetical protein